MRLWVRPKYVSLAHKLRVIYSQIYECLPSQNPKLGLVSSNIVSWEHLQSNTFGIAGPASYNYVDLSMTKPPWTNCNNMLVLEPQAFSPWYAFLYLSVGTGLARMFNQRSSLILAKFSSQFKITLLQLQPKQSPKQSSKQNKQALSPWYVFLFLSVGTDLARMFTQRSLFILAKFSFQFKIMLLQLDPKQSSKQSSKQNKLHP